MTHRALRRLRIRWNRTRRSRPFWLAQALMLRWDEVVVHKRDVVAQQRIDCVLEVSPSGLRSVLRG